ncbi:MAG: HAD-IC family P-type ATPase, partial [Syntrophales bacterium]|nr:HAD-IC family P-type ATPase [Syntrophales bacterium]
MEKVTKKQWHSLHVSEVIALFESHPDQGLDITKTEVLRNLYGPNVITVQKGHGPFVRFLLQFHQPLIYILLVSSVITAFLQEWVDAGVIFGVVLVNAIIGFIQETKAVRAIDALARTMTTEATVIRSGQKMRIPSPEVLPGDIVLLQAGDKVPADLRLISSRDLRIDESALTGESLPVEKDEKILPTDTVLAERKNMAYGSTLVTFGQATGVVVATGDATEVGRISELMAETDQLETPLLRKITAFSKVLLYVILALAAVTFLVGLLQGRSAFDMFMAAIALAVAAIPEGLPAAMTITLAIGVARMARRNAIIRNLPAVETLGSTTVICSDKTGTLTENQMTVREIVAGGETYEVSGSGYAPMGEILLKEGKKPTALSSALKECLRCGLICNDSFLEEEGGRWVVKGDPTEGALITAATKAGMDADTMSASWPRLDTLPFSSEQQYMATLHGSPESDAPVVYVKGSLEAILARCGHALSPRGEQVVLNKELIKAEADKMAFRGLRVLAFARKELPAGTRTLCHEDIVEGLVFIGLQGMIDPPRAEAIEAVRKCHNAGIRVKMITGDHAITAAAIAGQIG